MTKAVISSENIKKRCTPSTERIFGKLRAAYCGPVTKTGFLIIAFQKREGMLELDVKAPFIKGSASHRNTQCEFLKNRISIINKEKGHRTSEYIHLSRPFSSLLLN
ncbi:hypothetical protein [Peribacillus sp. SI8-4]|uniref:hypothetical protein n=1 Tax=Peribacillus sp. SI8-4 TaxID=3048009 RepID=UPI0025569FBD|nr:hypothetical protein [Peribacillus sp. SI8-4]